MRVLFKKAFPRFLLSDRWANGEGPPQASRQLEAGAEGRNPRRREPELRAKLLCKVHNTWQKALKPFLTGRAFCQVL